MLLPRGQPLLPSSLRGNLPSGGACLITEQKHGQTIYIIFHSFTDANRWIEEADLFMLNAKMKCYVMVQTEVRMQTEIVSEF